MYICVLTRIRFLLRQLCSFQVLFFFVMSFFPAEADVPVLHLTDSVVDLARLVSFLTTPGDATWRHFRQTDSLDSSIPRSVFAHINCTLRATLKLIILRSVRGVLSLLSCYSCASCRSWITNCCLIHFNKLVVVVVSRVSCESFDVILFSIMQC